MTNYGQQSLVQLGRWYKPCSFRIVMIIITTVVLEPSSKIVMSSRQHSINIMLLEIIIIVLVLPLIIIIATTLVCCILIVWTVRCLRPLMPDIIIISAAFVKANVYFTLDWIHHVMRRGNFFWGKLKYPILVTCRRYE